MPLVRENVVPVLVNGALAATDTALAYEALLAALRAAAGAERALLAQASEGGAVLVHAVPEAAEERFDAERLATAFDAAQPVTPDPPEVHGGVLALGLHPRPDGAWAIGLVRPAPPWTRAERAGLAELRPYIELVLEHALLRSRLAAAQQRAATDAAEHERFLSVISHELRNPLAPILMWTSTLKRLRAEDPEVQRAAQAIAHAVSLERRLIEELLDFSRLERGVLELAPQRVDLRDVVRGTIDAQRGALADAGIALEEDLSRDAVAVRGDPLRLGQVVTELVGNAIKFTPAGGRIVLCVARRDRQGEIVVSDTGPGIPAQILPRLFTPFVQGANARGGLGLGLALAQRLVALHGGTLVGSNRAEGGATLRARLPLVREAD